MLVAIGDSPYEANSRTHDADNGMWRVDAETIEKALERMFNSMNYPGAATGRYRDLFIPEVSIPFPADEVIQVWTHDPHAIARLEKVLEEFQNRREYYVPHDGKGHHMGVVMELHISALTKYIKPIRQLLAPVAGESRTLSPLGASLVSIDQRKQEIQQSMLRNQYAVDLKRRDMELLEEQMEAQSSKLETGMALLRMYMHGSDYTVTLCEGDKAPIAERWHVFQNRQFLNTEIAVLANFEDFDFMNMEALDEWLVKTGRIWKMLPFNKTILATRIRDTSKDYHDVFSNVYWNELNFQNILWVRNGKTVVRVNVEHQFENAIFPDPNSERKLIAKVEEKLWKDHFSTTRFGRFTGDADEEEKPEPLGFKKNADSEAEPYVMAQIVMRRFKTMELWRSSKEYESLQPHIRQKVFDYLRDKNQEQMSFLMLLQGIVDRTGLLDVPPGSDLFQSEVCSRYFELVFDYSHGLPDHTYAKAMLNHTTNVKKGDWIIVPYIYTPKGNKHGVDRPRLYHVYNVIDGEPMVKYHPISRRRTVNPGEHWWEAERRPVKNGRPARLGNVPYLRIDLNAKLAEQILDDREWKMKNEWMVPVLANWRVVQKKYLAAPVNGATIELETPK